MRIAHVTDIHVERPILATELTNKRLLGAVNLHVLGRASHFTEASQRALVEAVQAVDADLVLCTGDLTSTATEAEFTAARALLSPIMRPDRWLVIPGNHDVYTSESLGRFAASFGEVAPARSVSVGGWDIVLVDVCHPDWLSRGWLGSQGLDLLETSLSLGEAPALVALHYPLRGRDGERYGPFSRACADAEAIEGVLLRYPRVKLIVHGHEHHGFRTELRTPWGGTPILDPGAGGYAFLPERRRTAHFCVYELDAARLVDTQRFAFDGERFVPEPGGAFATGR